MLFVLIVSADLCAEVKLALPFSDHMVLQRGLPVPVWGKATAGEVITVHFSGQAKSATTATDGKWMIRLDPMEASAEGREMKVQGADAITLRDVLVGEVWLCSGQSNMAVDLERLKTTVFISEAFKSATLARVDQELATTTPGLRLLRLGSKADDKLKNIWTACDPETLKRQARGVTGFSAVGYFFGKKLQAELKVPVGLVVVAVGGTIIETWIPPTGANFRQLVDSVLPFAVRGALWYQGESNVMAGDEGAAYADKMAQLIQGWRNLWQQPDLPFYYVQLPPMPYSERPGKIPVTTEALPQLRDGQAQALRLPHTGMVVTTDLADAPDLHPTNKWDVGERLALLALAQSYQRKDVVYSGPRFRAMEIRGGKVALSFDHVEGGLVSKDGKPLSDFMVAGADRHFVAASAVIEGDKVILANEKVSQPVAVRFGWHEVARPNLFNGAGLPAAPFRTDDWPVKIVAPSVTDSKPASLPKR